SDLDSVLIVFVNTSQCPTTCAIKLLHEAVACTGGNGWCDRIRSIVMRLEHCSQMALASVDWFHEAVVDLPLRRVERAKPEGRSISGVARDLVGSFHLGTPPALR